MTYYEELGLSRNATAEEIREAYKQLARLLHPDLLQDEKQRSLAETQMKRLNHVYDTLSHPERRREYDFSIQDFGHPELTFVAEPPVRRHRPQHRGRRRPDWENAFRRQVEKHSLILAALVGAFVTFLLIPASDPQPAGPVQAAPAEAPLRLEPAAAEPRHGGAGGDQGLSVLIAGLRNRLRQAEQERDQALARMRGLEKKVEDLSSGRPAATAEVAPILPPAPAPEVATAPQLPAPAPKAAPGARTLSGRWYYVRPTGGEPPQNLYPPEYIEMVVADDSTGQIRGRYRARYRISDRAIPPEVAFQFAGPAQRESAVLSWTGAGGATGEVRMRLLKPNVMELAWVASDLGRHQGLGYGTAILVRRQEP
jgi:curved DNA-binding protein CbpA